MSGRAVHTVCPTCKVSHVSKRHDGLCDACFALDYEARFPTVSEGRDFR